LLIGLATELGKAASKSRPGDFHSEIKSFIGHIFAVSAIQ